MRIALNAWFHRSPSTGSGQYTRQLAQALLGLGTEHEFLLIDSDETEWVRSSGAAFQRASAPRGGFSADVAKTWFEQRSFPAACVGAAVDVAHVPYFGSSLIPRVATVVTVHDLIPLLFPEYRLKLRARLYFRMVGAAAHRAACVVTDSSHSQGDIAKHLHIPTCRIEVIPLAPHAACRPVTDQPTLTEARAKYRLPETYLLYLGGFDVRKNVPLLMRVYARALSMAHHRLPPLVIAGRLPGVDTVLFPDPRRVAEEFGIANQVVFTGWVAEEDKAALYSGASLFIFLSLYEGFGLEPLEAMACGSPVLVSQRSSLPEVVGSAGVLVEPTDVEEVAERVVQLVSSPALRRELARAGLERAAAFRWSFTAERTLRVYERVALSGSRGRG